MFFNKTRKKLNPRSAQTDLLRLFDENFYRTFCSNPAPHKTLFDQYMHDGWKLGYSPNALFDNDRYLANYPDVANAGMNPLFHFVMHGAAEGRQPNALFDPQYYWSLYGDVRAARVNPLAHYLAYGASEGRKPHPLFDPNWFAARHPGPRGQELATFLRTVHRDAHPLFSDDWYVARYPGCDADGKLPIEDFLMDGWRNGRQPHPLFDARWYLATNGDIAAAGINPLLHFLSSGHAEGRNPHALFDMAWFRKSNGKRARTHENALVAYLAAPASEALQPHPQFDAEWYIAQHEDRLASGEPPLMHYLRVGWKEGRDPSPNFDVGHYLSMYPDVRQSGGEPFTHYVTTGQAEGRFPEPANRKSWGCRPLDIPFELQKAPASLAGKDVCFFNTFTADGRVHGHVDYLLKALQQAGLTVVVIVATDGLTVPLPASFVEADGLIVRSNHGYDFAAWATAMVVCADVWSANSLVLCNDSIYGPTDPAALAAIIDRVRSSESDIVALTDSYEVRHHFMSYFTALTRSGLQKEEIRDWWGTVGSVLDKQIVINTYELFGVDAWRAKGAKIEVLFPTTTAAKPNNPTLAYWRDLLSRGFPFLKVQLLRDDLSKADPTGWQDELKAAPQLRRLIETHLSALGADKRRLQLKTAPAAANACHRPVPAPNRRFKRLTGIKTYYGASQGVRPRPETDLALEVPFGEPTAARLPDRVAAIMHIFYPDTLPDILTRLAYIPTQTDLYISTDTEEKRQEILGYGKEWQIEVRVLENRGRDIAPFLVGFRDIFDRYDVVLHVHSKRSPHEPRMAGWRDHLLDTLIGSREIVGSILQLLAKPEVGMVFAQHYPEVRRVLNWGFDFTLAQELLARLGVTLRQDYVLDFPSSSFFWAKTAALRPLLNVGLNWSDFPPEEGQVDGTIAHAIERSLPIVCEAAGFSWLKVGRSESINATTLVPVPQSDELAAAIWRVERRLTGNRIVSTVERAMLPELCFVTARRAPSTRPRLNLILPTLHPKHVFGGITTALKTFEAIADALGDTYDRRILCTTTHHDLPSALLRPAYRHIQLNDPNEDLPRTLLDLANPEIGDVPVRAGDIFMTTAWWTANCGMQLQDAQAAIFGAASKMIYLIQDHEVDFYARSSVSGLAQATYGRPNETIALINSEELARFMIDRYGLTDAQVVRYEPNPQVAANVTLKPRERLILIYGRPTVQRNCFNTLIAGLRIWQSLSPEQAGQWRILSIGESFDVGLADGVANFDVSGKLSLEEYGSVLSRAAVGVSLMASPHPSYPPLEMAAAGIATVTNRFENKDLTLRNSAFINIDHLTPEAVAQGLARAVAIAEPRIGQQFTGSPIVDIPCSLPTFKAESLAERLRSGL